MEEIQPILRCSHKGVVDYYKILGVAKSAGAHEIRAAYKRQAMVHHPDHNPGKPQAEDIFKILNEAYHVLSDPHQRAKYDRVLQRPDWKGVRGLDPSRAEYLRRVRDLRMQQYMQWKRSGGKTYEYRIDKEYFRIMALTWAVFFLLAALAYSFFTYISLAESPSLSTKPEAESRILGIQQLFRSGRIEESLRAFRSLPEAERRHYDSLKVTMTRALAAGAHYYYTTGRYRDGLDAFLLLYEFEQVPSAATWRGIGLCKMGLGLSDEAEAALRVALRRDPDQEEAICAELSKFAGEPAARLAEQICNDY